MGLPALESSVPLLARSPRDDRLTPAGCARVHDASMPMPSLAACDDELGPDGSFLGAHHTLAHHREGWYPSLIDRLSHPSWVARGGTTLVERAAARVDRILAGDEPPPRSGDAIVASAGILERATTTLRSGSRP